MEDRLKCIAAFGTIFFTSFNTFFSSMMNFIERDPHTVTVLLAIMFFGTSIIFCLLSIVKMKANTVILSGMFLLSYLISAILFSNNREYLFGQETISYMWFRCVPVFICLSTVKSKESLFFAIEKMSYIVISLQTVVSFASNAQSLWVDRSNYMEIAYQLLLPVSFLVLKQKKNRIDLVFIGLGSFIIFFEGARGAVFALAICFIYKIIGNKRDIKLIIVSLLSLIVFLAVYINLNSILEIVLRFASQRGLNGHFIRALRVGQLLVSYGRIADYRIGMKLIKDNWFTGCGLGGERYYLGGVYVHNIILEILIDFGVFFGAIVLIWLTKVIIFMFLERNEEIKNVCLALFFSMGFLKLLLSSSYIIEPSFFAMIAIATNQYFKLLYKETRSTVDLADE